MRNRPTAFRRPIMQLIAGLAGLAAAMPAGPATAAESVVTIAMTAGDIPITTGIPDQGGEGARFVGLNLYDGLLKYEKMNEDAVMVWIVHDLNPRALAPNLRGFKQAQSWYQDLTPITVAP